MAETSIRAFVDHEVDPAIRGFLHTPDTPSGNGLVLTHGAGSNAQAPLLIALAETFAAAGFTVLRCDLPYRQTRSYGPPGPGDAARDRAGLKNAVTSLKKVLESLTVQESPLLATPSRSGASHIFLGGHSYGGRQASMLSAEEPDLVAGLLLLSYPLHPPRKPEQQRTQHLPDLRTPALFVSG
ncbi:MAG TPA: alpha/beta fold hydrolase, partial [Candidatus Sulfotelmatobacter sp.]|nr:alpha/beta fold hydrolase [Candidatus Sulfotelmatobacter sp.]